MHTARFSSQYLDVIITSPQVNKFEQVSSDDQQMSVAGRGVWYVTYPIMHVMYYPPPPSVDRHLWKHYLPLMKPSC